MVLPSSETHTELASDTPALSMTPEETLVMVEDWLRNDPGLSFKRASTDLQKLNLVITPRQFSEVKRRLGITTGPPRPTPSRTAPAIPNLEPNGVPKTPLMTFTLEFLRGSPGAAYGDVKTAGVASGFTVTPINYGRARKMLGLSRPKKPARERRHSGAGRTGTMVAPVAEVGVKRPKIRRRRGMASNLGDLSAMVLDLQAIVDERDRLRVALDQIAKLIRSV